MGLLEDVGVYLQQQGLGTIAVTLFYGGHPDTPDDELTLFEYSGPAPEFENSEEPFAWERPSLQLASRAVDPLTARNFVRNAWSVLIPLKNVWLIDDQGKKTRYREINPLQSPYQVGRDDNRRFLWVANFQIVKRPRPEL